MRITQILCWLSLMFPFVLNAQIKNLEDLNKSFWKSFKNYNIFYLGTKEGEYKYMLDMGEFYLLNALQNTENHCSNELNKNVKLIESAQSDSILSGAIIAEYHLFIFGCINSFWRNTDLNKNFSDSIAMFEIYLARDHQYKEFKKFFKYSAGLFGDNDQDGFNQIFNESMRDTIYPEFLKKIQTLALSYLQTKNSNLGYHLKFTKDVFPLDDAKFSVESLLGYASVAKKCEEEEQYLNFLFEVHLHFINLKKESAKNKKNPIAGLKFEANIGSLKDIQQQIFSSKKQLSIFHYSSLFLQQVLLYRMTGASQVDRGLWSNYLKKLDKESRSQFLINLFEVLYHNETRIFSSENLEKDKWSYLSYQVWMKRSEGKLDLVLHDLMDLFFDSSQRGRFLEKMYGLLGELDENGLKNLFINYVDSMILAGKGKNDYNKLNFFISYIIRNIKFLQEYNKSIGVVIKNEKVFLHCLAR